MKKLAVMLLALLVITGCHERDTTAWVLTGQDTDLVARVGSLKDNVEVGVVAKYGVSGDIEWGPVPDAWGPYLLFHLTHDITVSDEPQASPLKPLLDALHAQPYAGLELATNDELSDVQPNWIAGTTFTLNDDGKAALVVEYTDGDQAAGDTFVGIRLKF